MAIVLTLGMNIQTIPCYSGKQGTRSFRTPVSITEMIAHCDKHSHIWLRTRNGDARQVKVNGKVRTWKRNAGRVEVPFKYGLYEYGKLQASDITDVLIPC